MGGSFYVDDGKSPLLSHEDLFHDAEVTDEYNLIPRASPLPPKTPPRSPRSPPPRPLSGSRFPSIAASIAGLEATELIGFEGLDGRSRDVRLPRSPTPPSRRSPPIPTLSRQASRRSSLMAHSPVPPGEQMPRSRLGTVTSPDQPQFAEPYGGARPRDRRLMPQPSIYSHADSHYGSRATLQSAAPDSRHGSKSGLHSQGRESRHGSRSGLQLSDQLGARGLRQDPVYDPDVPLHQGGLSPHPSAQSVHDSGDPFFSMPGARSVPRLTPQASFASHVPSDMDDHHMPRSHGGSRSSVHSRSRQPSRSSHHDVISPVDTVIPRPSSVHSVQSIPPPPSKQGSTAHLPDVMSSSGSSHHGSDVTRLAAESGLGMGEVQGTEQLPPPPSVVRPPSDIDEIEMEQPEEDEHFLPDDVDDDDEANM